MTPLCCGLELDLTVTAWTIEATDAAKKLHGKSEEGDVDELFLNALGIRWLLFDEGSALALSLLGTLDAYLRRACKKHPYALRGRTPRPFGGING